MVSLINQAFEKAKSEKRPALLTYTVAGDNTKKKSLEILKSISNYADDICLLKLFFLLKLHEQNHIDYENRFKPLIFNHALEPYFFL